MGVADLLQTPIIEAPESAKTSGIFDGPVRELAAQILDKGLECKGTLLGMPFEIRFTIPKG